MKKLIASAALLIAVVILLQGCQFLGNINNILDNIFDSNITTTNDPNTNVAPQPTDLEKCIDEMQNYIAEYKLTIENSSKTENIKYFIDGDITKKVYNEGAVEKTEYQVNTRGQKAYYFNYDGEFFKLSENNQYYDSFFLDFFGFDNIDAEAFEKTGDGEWTSKADRCSLQAKYMLGDFDGEIFTSFVIKAQDGVITKAILSADYVNGSDKHKREYEITFSEHGGVDLELPTATELKGDEYLEYADRNSLIYYGGYNGLTSKGTPNLLVVPVCFSGESFTQKELADLKTALYGTEAQTGWHSVASYYRESSRGELELSFTVTDPYVCKNPSNYYSSRYSEWRKDTKKTSPDAMILSEVIEVLDERYDLSEYDSDSDGFIDAIYLVYSHATNYYDAESFWWSWATTAEIDIRYDGVFAGEYMWVGIDTLDEPMTEQYKPNQNASTLIHETGHLLGLRDYYDTNKSVGTSGGVGGGDMMDSSVGDHCPASKIILDWADIKNVTATGRYSLEAYEESNHCIVIKKDSVDGFDCEYIVIDLYTPTGLYETSAGTFGLPTRTGVRIWHVDATLVDYTYGLFFAVYNANNATTEHKFVKLIEADGKNDIDKSTEFRPVYSDNSDLFFRGMEFGDNYTWYDGTPLGFTVSIDSISPTSAEIKVTFEN